VERIGSGNDFLKSVLEVLLNVPIYSKMELNFADYNFNYFSLVRLSWEKLSQ